MMLPSGEPRRLAGGGVLVSPSVRPGIGGRAWAGARRGWAAWHRPGEAAKLWVGLPFDGQPTGRGNGWMAALAAPSRAAVDAAHAAALAAGGRDEGAPGPRPHYAADYYGAYVRDPDGNK